MPSGVYHRTPEMLANARKNLAKGHEPAVRAKALKSIRENAANPDWKQKMSRIAKQAMRDPEIRQRHLEGLCKYWGLPMSSDGKPVPTIKTKLKIAEEYIDRFWARVTVKGPDECWDFCGRNGQGEYGKCWCSPKIKEISAHRFVLMLVLGRDLEEGEHALHLCDNPPCCNPRHLYIGTHADNMRDKRLKKLFSHLSRKNAIEFRRRIVEGKYTEHEAYEDFS